MKLPSSVQACFRPITFGKTKNQQQPLPPPTYPDHELFSYPEFQTPLPSGKL